MFLPTIYLPWLLNMFPYSYWASTCMAAFPTYSAFMISVRQASDLPPASFRFPVTRDTLALGYILPAVGRIRDFHPLKHAPAGRTIKKFPQAERFAGIFYLCAISCCRQRRNSWNSGFSLSSSQIASVPTFCSVGSAMVQISLRPSRF